MMAGHMTESKKHLEPAMERLPVLQNASSRKDAKEINVVSNNVTLDEWFKIWFDTCKQGCRASTKETYMIHYKRVQADLGWRKITALNLVVMQDAIHKLCSDNARKNSKKILVDMLDKAVDTNLLVKNVAKQINPIITREKKKE